VKVNHKSLTPNLMDSPYPTDGDSNAVSSKPKRAFLRKGSGFISSASKRKLRKHPVITPEKSSSEGSNSSNCETPQGYDTVAPMVPIKTPVIVSKNNYEPLDEPLDEAPPISPSTNEDDSNEVDDFAEMEKMLGLGDGDDELEGASDLVPASSSFPPPLGKVVPPQLRMRQDAPKLPCEATPPKEEYVRDDVGDDGDDWGYDDEEVQEAEPVNYDYFGADGRANGEQDDDMDSYASETNYARSSYSTRHMPEGEAKAASIASCLVCDERSDSKRIIPRSYATNKLPFVASLLAPLIASLVAAKRQPAHPPAMTTMSSSLVQSVFAPPKPPPSKTVNMSTFSSSTLPTTTVHQLKAREAEAESKVSGREEMTSG